MNFIKIKNVTIAVLIVGVVMPLNLAADGSIPVYNYSLYKVNLIITPQSGVPLSVSFDKAPTTNGVLSIHPVDANYIFGSNVPMGTVKNVAFSGTAKNFDIQIIKDNGTLLKQINVGSTLDTVIDVDPARAIYIYSNNNAAGTGGVVFFWNGTKFPLSSPSVQEFLAA